MGAHRRNRPPKPEHPLMIGTPNGRLRLRPILGSALIGLALISLLFSATVSAVEPSAGMGTTSDSPKHIRVEFDDGLISIRAEEASLGSVIERIALETNLAVLATGRLDQRISVRIQRRPLAVAVAKVLRHQSYVLLEHPPSSGEGARVRALTARLWILVDEPWPAGRGPLTLGTPWASAASGTGMLPSSDREERLAAISNLDEAASPRATETLLIALTDTDPRVREEAVYALGVRGDRSALEPLAGALTDPDSGVREAAIEALIDLGGEASAQSLAVLLADPKRALRLYALEALAEIRGDAAIDLLQQALGDSDEQVREVAAELLDELGRQENG